MELGSDALVNRIKHATLSLRAPYALVSFRKTFKRILKECVDIDMEGGITRSKGRGTQHKRGGNMVAIPHDGVKLKRATILTFCNSDWRERGKVRHCGKYSSLSQDCLVRSIVTNVTAGLVGSGPGNFPSRNWIRSHEAAAWFGMMDLLHGLLPIVYSQWVEECTGQHLAHRVGSKAIRPGDANHGAKDAHDHDADWGKEDNAEIDSEA